MATITTSKGSASNSKVKVYLVGGAVRDKLLNVTPKDKDFVIVGADVRFAEALLAIGFEQVGADFPVYLHPDTKEEFAFARIDRKVCAGYSGFSTITSPDLTIEEDLIRRDLTINAMAIDLETDELIDPFNGAIDLAEGIIRHTSEAFVEDPLRVLRIARFIARYNFTVADETMILIRQMMKSGELSHLVPDRVITELNKIISEKSAGDGIHFLIVNQIFNAIHPSLDKITLHDLHILDKCVYKQCSLAVRFASIFYNLTANELRAMRFNSYTERFTLLYARFKADITVWPCLKTDQQRDILIALKALQQEMTFIDHMLQLLQCDNAVSSSILRAFNASVEAFRNIDNNSIINEISEPKKFGAAIMKEQLRVLQLVQI